MPGVDASDRFHSRAAVPTRRRLGRESERRRFERTESR